MPLNETPTTPVRKSGSGISAAGWLASADSGKSPFAGDIVPSRVPMFAPGSGRPTLPFPHPWNYHDPIRVLESCFHGADAIEGSGRHSRYLDIPGFTPFLITRDPGLIRAIMLETGDRPGQFDRDTLPFVGIAQATGKNTLLSSNGPDVAPSTKARRDTVHERRSFSARALRRSSRHVPPNRHRAARRAARTPRQERRNERADRARARDQVRDAGDVDQQLLRRGDSVRRAAIGVRARLERVIEHIVRDTVLGQLRRARTRPDGPAIQSEIVQGRQRRLRTIDQPGDRRAAGRAWVVEPVQGRRSAGRGAARQPEGVSRRRTGGHDVIRVLGDHAPGAKRRRTRRSSTKP